MGGVVGKSEVNSCVVFVAGEGGMAALESSLSATRSKNTGGRDAAYPLPGLFQDRQTDSSYHIQFGKTNELSEIGSSD